MRYLYMEQIIIFYCQYRAASHAKQAVLIPKPVLFMLATQCPGLCCPLETNFWWFQNSTVDERHSSTQNLLSLDFLKGFFLDRWEVFVLHPSTKIQQLSSTFQVYWVLTDHVSFGWGDAGWNQVFSCNQFGDFFLDRWEVFILHPSTKSPDSCQALFEFYWWMTDDVSFEWAFTSYNQVLSCKQFGDFSLNRWEMFVPNKGSSSSLNKNSQQLSSTFWIIE